MSFHDVYHLLEIIGIFSVRSLLQVLHGPDLQTGEVKRRGESVGE